MRRAVRNIVRLIRIARILARYDALFLLDFLELGPGPARLARLVLGRRRPGRRPLRRGQRIAAALQELGPSFIKFGQSWSTRADLIGDPRFDDEDERAKNADEATAAITEWTTEHTKDEAWRIIARGGVLAGATYNTEEILEREHLREREMVVTVDDPVRGDYTMIGVPIKLSEEHTTVTKAPRYGKHNDSVLKTILGCTDDDIAGFRENGVIA